MSQLSHTLAPRVAIVGCGPSGCYTAQFLRRNWPDAEITVFDRLPVPFGLVRHGVAPDHQGTKAVDRQFDRLFVRNGVHFVGNVEIGTDLTLEELRAWFDVVVLAVGISGDRVLDVPGARLDGVYGSGRITRLFNDHPDEQGFLPSFGERVVIVGNGNVAIDILRMLVKGTDHFAGSDLQEDILRRLRTGSVRQIDVVGRSPAHLAKFDPAMIRELTKVSGVRYEVDPGLAADDAKSAALTALGRLRPSDAAKTVRFHFGWTPTRIEGADRVRCLVAADSDGGELVIAADSVVTAIGFTDHPGRGMNRENLHDETADPTRGELALGLYCVGWFHRGPRGTIPENRTAAHEVAKNIVDGVAEGRVPLGKPGRAVLPSPVLSRQVDYSGWQLIDAAETAAARADRVRSKFRDRDQMIAVARGQPTLSPNR